MTHIHTPSEIRNRIPSKRAAADSLPRPRGHWNRLHHGLSISINASHDTDDYDFLISVTPTWKSLSKTWNLEIRRNASKTLNG